MSRSEILAALEKLQATVRARNNFIKMTIDTHLAQLESTLPKSNFLLPPDAEPILPIEPPPSSSLRTTHNPSSFFSPSDPSVSAAAITTTMQSYPFPFLPSSPVLSSQTPPPLPSPPDIQASPPQPTLATNSSPLLPTPSLPHNNFRPMEKRDKDLCYNYEHRWSPTRRYRPKFLIPMGYEDNDEAEPPGPLPVVVGDSSLVGYTHNFIQPVTDKTLKLQKRDDFYGARDFMGCTGQSPPTSAIISPILQQTRVSHDLLDQPFEIHFGPTFKIEEPSPLQLTSGLHTSTMEVLAHSVQLCGEPPPDLWGMHNGHCTPAD